MSAIDPEAAIEELLENLPQLDGFDAWREVDSEEWHRVHGTHATAYLEISTNRDEWSAVNLIAPPINNLPEFDDGAAADRAHDAAVDQQNGVL